MITYITWCTSLQNIRKWEQWLLLVRERLLWLNKIKKEKAKTIIKTWKPIHLLWQGFNGYMTLWINTKNPIPLLRHEMLDLKCKQVCIKRWEPGLAKEEIVQWHLILLETWETQTKMQNLWLLVPCCYILRSDAHSIHAYTGIVIGQRTISNTVWHGHYALKKSKYWYPTWACDVFILKKFHRTLFTPGEF